MCVCESQKQFSSQIAAFGTPMSFVLRHLDNDHTIAEQPIIHGNTQLWNAKVTKKNSSKSSAL